MKVENRLAETINQIKGWRDNTSDATTGLMESVAKACATPLRDLSDADLRILVGQKIALEISFPLAIERLRVDPWINAFYYEGDLLRAARDLTDEELSPFPGAREELEDLAVRPKPEPLYE